MKRLRIVFSVLLGLPALLVVAFVFNGTVFCRGTKPVQGGVKSEPVSQRQQDVLRVMSFNIAKCFVYTSGVHFASSKEVTVRLERICDIVNRNSPDVLVLNEIVRESGPGSVDQVLYIAGNTDLCYWAFGENFSFGFPFLRVVSGNAVLSRFPVKAELNIDLCGRRPFYVTRNNRRALGCRVLLPGEPLSVWAIHNDSFNLENNLLQVRQLLEHSHTEGAVMAGDFNARPSDASIEELVAGGMFVGVTNGPNTFPAWKPTRTIDFIFGPSDWEVVEHRVIDDEVSDHRAVLTVFSADTR